jgi:hypothetical protein
MDALPPFWTLPFGCLVGVMAFSPVSRWFGFFLTVVIKDSRRTGVVFSGSRLLPILFATVLNPIPWLLLLGVPYGAYKLWLNPPSPTWQWFLAGCVLGPLLLVIYVAVIFRRVRRAKLARDASPD